MATLQDTTIENLTVSTDLSGMSTGFSRPNLPIVVASKSNGGSCHTALGPVPFNNIELINGNIIASNSNSRFTVSESGKYYLLFWTIGHDNCGSTGRLHINVNGAIRTAQARTDTSIRYGNCYCYAVVDIQVGDYVEADQTAGALYFNSSVYNKFVMYKIF